MTRIAHAFCRQLNRLVTIDEARTAFLRTHDIERYDFFCAEPACAGYQIRIAGVNYRIDAATGRKFVENHFRRWDDHRPGCPYADLPAADHADDTEGREGGCGHRTHALAGELVEAFNPPVDDLPGFEKQAVGAEPPPAASVHPHRPPTAPRQAPAAATRRLHTASLAKLVDSYREALALLTPREFAARRIAVAGEGRLALGQYFLRIGTAHEGPPLRVHYGGARLVRYYGRGFKLRFYDRFRGKPVYLYVASSAVRTAAESAVLIERLNAMEQGEYSTVYVLGRLDAALDDASYSIAVTDLRRLVLHAPRSRHPAPDSASVLPG